MKPFAPLLAAAVLAALPAAGPAAAQSAPPVEAQLRDIQERPLFARSRKAGGGPQEPAAASAEAPAIVEATPAALAASDVGAQVIGVLIAPPVRKALLRFGSAPPEWIAEGTSAEGWRVSRVEDGGVVLSGAAGDIRLDLHEPAP